MTEDEGHAPGSDAESESSGTTAAGEVVDPIRIPPWLREPFEEAWREAPLVARVFVILALVDIVSRGLGILQPRYVIGLDLLSAYSMLIPHDLWVLLPAILVLRRPDAQRATPLVFWGAVVVAVVMVLSRPLENLTLADGGLSATSVEVDTLGALALLAGWAMLGRGLATLGSAQPRPAIAGISNAVIVIGAIGLLGQLYQGVRGGLAGDSTVAGIEALNLVVFLAQQVAWLYLLWVVIRGQGDLRRPIVATTTAAVGAGLSIVLSTLAVVLGVFAAGTPLPVGVQQGLGLADFGNAFGLLAYDLAQPLFLVAFVLGLADSPLTVAPSASLAASPAVSGDVAAEPAAR
jgi:hypothetical protein